MEIKTIAQNFYDYSLHIKGYSKHTIRRYKYVIDFFCKQSGVKTIDEVTVKNIRALFLHGRIERHWSSNTVLVFHKSLMVFLRWCKIEGFIATNPVEEIEKIQIEQKLPVKLTKQDALLLLEIVENYPYKHNYLRYRNHALFAMFIHAGLRKNELLNLKYADVDLENCSIFVRQGKGCKDRFVPISGTLTKSLERYLEQRRKWNKTCPAFFASRLGNRALTENGLNHLVKVIQIASPVKFTVHKLRHTFATLLLEGGCDIFSLSKMMGHSDIKTTTIYLSASVEHLRGQMMKHPLNK